MSLIKDNIRQRGYCDKEVTRAKRSQDKEVIRTRSLGQREHKTKRLS